MNNHIKSTILTLFIIAAIASSCIRDDCPNARWFCNSDVETCWQVRDEAE